MNGTIVCLGELLIRLTAPGRELLLQSGRLDVHVGGAEANVAVALSSLGHDTRMVTTVPDNALGGAAVGELRQHGVDTSHIAVGSGRMGLYFVTPGAGLRASEVIYDREASSFARLDEVDWKGVLSGAGLLHLSGITPALGPVSAALARSAVAAAAELGVPVSFDGNYRAQLWQRWDGDPRALLTPLVEGAEILFGNHRDIALLLGRDFSGDGEHRRREAAAAAFLAFPRLKYIASTARRVVSADENHISARIDSRDRAAQTAEMAVTGIVDRIGAGDAFAAGVLHGLLGGADLEACADTGLALACLKHSLPGDACLFRQADIDAFLAGNFDVRR
jgi:2-dehydro-3-deoxygluconokinase